MKWSLRIKLLGSVGFIIFIVLGTSTFFQVWDVRQDSLQAIEWHSGALAQSLLKDMENFLKLNPASNLEEILGTFSPQCSELYEANKDKNITHVAVINSSGIIAAHNDTNLGNTQVESPDLLEPLLNHQEPKQITVLDSTTYHTFVPIFGASDTYIGAIDIGASKKLIDEKIWQLIFRSVQLFVIFLVVSFFTISVLMHTLLTKPVRRLVGVGQQLASGRLIQTFQTASGDDEIADLGSAFHRVANYLQHVAEVASQVSTGVLDSDVQMRSEDDVLGKAVHEMLQYLRRVAFVAKKIADGNLTETVQIRSKSDAFGRAIQAMTVGLRTLIEQIRTSAEKISATRTTISSLATQDINIIQDVHSSVETMVSTMQKIEASVENVAQGMDTLSSSMQDSSDSVLLITSSISLIASNANELTARGQMAIGALKDAVQGLEGIVGNTDTSAQLSQATIQDALEGQKAFEQVMNSMETIQQTITTAVDTITRFVERSRDIDTVLNVIREITDQTALLALNASIIAAQAGAHGRGFAVVADEIKNLADGVSDSTKDIAKIVHGLQQETNSIVETIHEGAANVKQGMDRTQQAQETLEKIIGSARRSSSVVTEIANALHDVMETSRSVVVAMEEVSAMTQDFTIAANEQEMSTDQINQAIMNINTLTSEIHQETTQQLAGVHRMLDDMKDITRLANQSLGSSQQINATTEELSLQADLLLQLVERFKLSS